MPDQPPQTYKNHARLDPPVHFFLLPFAAFFVIYSGYVLVRRPIWDDILFFLVSLAFAVAAFKIRLYSLKVQDRVIRLEERIRLERLLAEPLRSRIGELSESQLIALRFASDGEVASLVHQTLTNQWKSSDIKKAIQHWRPDYLRV